MTNAIELAREYLAHYRSAGFPDGEHTADATIDRLTREAPWDAWRVILELVRQADGEDAIFYIAAGPLEDLLARHGPLVIDTVEAEARTNERLRACLTGVWGNSIAAAVWQRLQSVATEP